MNQQIAIQRVRWLIGVHFLLGCGSGAVALAWPGFDWPLLVQVGYLALVVSEAMLLGMWIGFSGQPWLVRAGGGLVGAAWLYLLAFAPFPLKSLAEAIQLSGFMLPIPFVVALAALGLRWWLTALRRADEWPAPAPGKDWQFTLGSLIGFMLAVSMLLALGKFLHNFDRGSALVFVGVVCLIAVLAIGLLVWACLGIGRPAVRVPVATTGMFAIGMLVPYYTADIELWRYLIWAGLMFAISVLMIGTLLVLRSCGYRLVPVGQQALDRQLPAS